jgi:hypothetical protein
VTVTDVPSLMVSVAPAMAQPALGLQPTVTDTSAPEVRRGTVMVFAPTCNDGAAHPRVGAVRTGVARGRGRGAGAGALLNDRPGAGVAVRRGLGRVVARGTGDTVARVAAGVAVGVLEGVVCVTDADVDAVVGIAMPAVVGAEMVGVGAGGGVVVAAVGWAWDSVVVASGVAWAVDGVPAVADGTRSMLARMPKRVQPVNAAAAARPKDRGVRCMTGPWPSRASG